MDTKKQFELGPTLAIVIVLSAAVIAGLYVYQQMVKQSIADVNKGSQISAETIAQIRQQQADERAAEQQRLAELSSATDTDTLSAEIEADLQAGFSDAELNALDEELLDFEDLDDIDFSLESESSAQ